MTALHGAGCTKTTAISERGHLCVLVWGHGEGPAGVSRGAFGRSQLWRCGPVVRNVRGAAYESVSRTHWPP